MSRGNYTFESMLKTFREVGCKLTQKEFAKRLNYDISTISDWENGKYYPSRNNLNKLIHFLINEGVLSEYEKIKTFYLAAYPSDEDIITPDFFSPSNKQVPPPAEIVLNSNSDTGPNNIPYFFVGILAGRPEQLRGREDDIRNIKNILNEALQDVDVAARVVIRGMPGVGKSTLARALTYNEEIKKKFPDGILWATIGDEPDILSQLQLWANEIDPHNLYNLKKVETRLHLFQKLCGLLKDKRLLIILDDVWNRADIEHLLVDGPKSAVLVTTRLDNVEIRSISPKAQYFYPLKVLKKVPAIEILKDRLGAVVDENMEAATDLVTAVEFLPLALKVAGRLLQKRGIDINSLTQEIITDGQKILNSKVPDDLALITTGNVAALLRKSTDKLDPLSRYHFALLGTTKVKPAWLKEEHILGIWSEEILQPKTRVVDKALRKEILDKIVDYGLLEYEEPLFYLHAILKQLAFELLTK